MKNLKDFLKVGKKVEKRLFFLNLLFIFVFLNIWDFAVNQAFFNGMIIGVVMFAPVVFLWFLSRFRATVLLTLLSIFEFVVMLVFVLEGFELGGSLSVKSVFWLPFLILSGVNMVVGLNIYSKIKYRKDKI